MRSAAPRLDSSTGGDDGLSDAANEQPLVLRQYIQDHALSGARKTR